MIMHIDLSELDGLFACFEAGETTKDDANLLRALIQQLQGQIETLERMVDDDAH